MVIKQFRYHFKGWPCTWRLSTVHWNAWTRVVVPLHIFKWLVCWSHAATFGVQSYIVVFLNPHYRRRRQDISFLHGQSHLCQWNRPRFGFCLGKVKKWPGKMPNMFSQDKSSGFPYSKRPSTHRCWSLVWAWFLQFNFGLLNLHFFSSLKGPIVPYTMEWSSTMFYPYPLTIIFWVVAVHPCKTNLKPYCAGICWQFHGLSFCPSIKKITLIGRSTPRHPIKLKLCLGWYRVVPPQVMVVGL